MLSKQQKMKYGELLRQQMKQKEDRKKNEEMEKRGISKNLQPPRQQQSLSYKPTTLQKQNTYQRQLDPKQQLQKKLQSQDYNYFGGMGGGGGGAPNKRNPDHYQQYQNNNRSQPNNMRMPIEQMQYSGKNNATYGNQTQDYNRQLPPQQLPPQQQQRLRTVQDDMNNYYPQNSYNPQMQQQQSISPQSINYRKSPDNMYYQQQDSLNSISQGRVSNPYQQPPPYPPSNSQNYQPNYNYRQDPRSQPVSYQYIPQTLKNNSRLQQQQMYNQPQSVLSYPQQSQNQYQPNQNPYQPPTTNPIKQQLQYYQQQSNLDRQNQQLQQVYRKGGRNLLKLQNQTIDQHLIKQKRKLQIQKQLKQQIQQAEKKKKQQKQRIKRQEEQEERKNKEYIAEQKRKIEEQNRKKDQAKRKIDEENVRNLQKKKQMEEEAKRKVQDEYRNRAQKQKRQIQMQRQRQQQEKQAQMRKNQPPQQQVHYENQNRRDNLKVPQGLSDQDNTSVISSDTSSLEKGFNTALSKQFFRKQREKNNPSLANQNKKLQKVTNQIQKMSNQIMQQRQVFDREIQRVKDQSERAQIDKKKAQQQISRLKRQLKRKMDQDNQKLLMALQSNDYKNNDYSRPPQNYGGRGKNLNQYEVNGQEQYPSFNKKKPLRQRQAQSLVQQQYKPQPMKYRPKQQEFNQFEQSNVGLISLDGDSKKIPLFLQHGDKLTLSQVQNFAKDSAFFQKGGLMNKNSPLKQKYSNKIQESIVQQVDQDREYVKNQSRKSNRNKNPPKSIYNQQKDQLDKLMDSRAKSRGGWGEMSSVNSDITKQIQQLLRKKDNNGLNSNGRPSSISNAGKQSLASNNNRGYAYDGISLNSNVGGGVGTVGTNGTMDLQRINGRNDARLRQLKNLGVETINTTNGDDDLNALDALLNKYK